MFGSQILEVGIGLILVFLLVSLILTAVRETIESFAKTRARDLERAIAELLKDPAGEGLRKELYTHPLVFSLFPGGLACTRFDEAGKVIERAKKNVPSYIPREVFSAALQDILKKEMARARQPGAAPQPDAAAGASALASGTAHVMQAYQALLEVSGGEAERVRKGIESWYDASMDRASGWFKRRTQLMLFVLGFGVAAALNINAIAIAQYLSTHEEAAARLADAASQVHAEHVAAEKAKGARTAAGAVAGAGPEAAVGDPAAANDAAAADGNSDAAVADESPGPAAGNSAATAKEGPDESRELARRIDAQVRAVGLPIGWDKIQWQRTADQFASNPVWALLSLLIGWAMVGFAATLGAPFWFDLLGKFMVVRSTVKPTEKSPDEVSKDGGTGGAPKKPKTEDAADEDDAEG